MQFVSGVQFVCRQCDKTESTLKGIPGALKAGTAAVAASATSTAAEVVSTRDPGCDIALSCSAFFNAS
jgi:hypothetical protein